MFVNEYLCESLTLGRTKTFVVDFNEKKHLLDEGVCECKCSICEREGERQKEKKGNGGTCKDQKILVLGLQACTTMPSVYGAGD